MHVKIGDKKVGPGNPCFFIAELGINHNGSLSMALKLIEVAVRAGANAVKFQKREVSVVYTREQLNAIREVDKSIIDNAMSRMEIEGVRYQVFPDENLRRLQEAGSRTTNGDLKYALEFGDKEYDKINRACLDHNITWSASAWDGLSANFINGFEDVAWLKIASACLTHTDLLRRVRNKRKPVILSTGGSTLEQVRRAVEILGHDDLIILHCVAMYPPSDADTNLRVMETLKRTFPDVPVGFSSHGTDVLPAVAAVAMGACVIEAHLTLDRNLPGSDHKASLTPDQFAEMIKNCRRVEELFGDGIKRVLPGEVSVMSKLRRVDDLGA